MEILLGVLLTLSVAGFVAWILFVREGFNLETLILIGWILCIGSSVSVALYTDIKHKKEIQEIESKCITVKILENVNND